jgi:hypothetical protein
MTTNNNNNNNIIDQITIQTEVQITTKCTTASPPKSGHKKTTTPTRATSRLPAIATKNQDQGTTQTTTEPSVR